jgi:hypothetical protein
MKKFKQWAFVLMVAGIFAFLSMTPAVIYLLTKNQVTN